jgi:DNA-binding transcriptional ArsR family regulator
MAKARAKGQGISPASLARAAIAFNAVRNPPRLAILARLAAGERHVGALVEKTGIGATSMGAHLRHLLAAALVEARAEGLYRFYSLTPRGRALAEIIGKLAEPGGGS